MNYLNILLYVIIFILFTIILCNLYMKTRVKTVTLDNTEGFTGSSNEIKSIENNENLAPIGNIQSIGAKYADLPLKEYCV